MKKPQSLLLATMILLNHGMSAQEGVEKTIVTSLKYEANTELQINLDGDVEVRQWKEDYIGIVIDISTNIEHQQTMGLLIANDRYFIDTEVDARQITTISSPYLKNQVTINKRPLKEIIRYKLLVPQYAKVQMPMRTTEVIAQVSSGDK